MTILLESNEESNVIAPDCWCEKNGQKNSNMFACFIEIESIADHR